MLTLKPLPLKPKRTPKTADSHPVQVEAIDLAMLIVLAEALLWSEPATFADPIHELDCNLNPTGYTLPPGKYPFVPKRRVERWDSEDSAYAAVATALFELSQPDAAWRHLNAGVFPPEFGGRIMIRIREGYLLLVGVGAARTVKAFPSGRANVYEQWKQEMRKRNGNQ